MKVSLRLRGVRRCAPALCGAVLLLAQPASRLGVLAATVEQPAPFSHRHHVSELGLDCRACHATVDISATAGMPDSATCTNCHGQALADGTPRAAPLPAAHAAPPPRLPDFVYFDHSVHGARGIACDACHGDVEHAQRSAQAATLTTGWCADCHRHRERVASSVIGRAAADAAMAAALRASRKAAPAASCKVQLGAAPDSCNLLTAMKVFSGT